MEKKLLCSQTFENFAFKPELLEPEIRVHAKSKEVTDCWECMEMCCNIYY